MRLDHAQCVLAAPQHQESWQSWPQRRSGGAPAAIAPAGPAVACPQTAQQLGRLAVLIQCMPQALWPEVPAWDLVGGIGLSLCPKPVLLQPILI